MGRVLLAGTTCVSPLARAPAWGVEHVGRLEVAFAAIPQDGDNCTEERGWDEAVITAVAFGPASAAYGEYGYGERFVTGGVGCFQDLLVSGISRLLGGLLSSTSLVCIPAVPVPRVVTNVQHGLPNGCKAGLGWRALSRHCGSIWTAKAARHDREQRVVMRLVADVNGALGYHPVDTDRG
jgi:hypothetical protein